jgi:hypothetical protein
LAIATGGENAEMEALFRLIYRPVGVVAGVLGGILAGAAFKRLWKLAAHDDTAPKPTDEDRGWAEVVLAGAVKGAVFGSVRAAVDRAGAAGFSRATGVWPGRHASKTAG